MKIHELSISARAKVCLLTAGYEELEDMKDITDEELLEIRNLNAKGVAEIREKIEEYFAEEDLMDFEDFYEDEFEDITIFQSDEKIGVTVEFCGLEFDAVSETITINIWVKSKSEDTYDIWIKDLYINGKLHKEYSNIGEISDYDSGYMEEVIDDSADVSYEEIRTIRFLVEINDENDNELANSKVVTISCNTEAEDFSVENINMYDESMKITIDELDFSARTYNCLKGAGINILGDICNRMWDDMIHVQNLGRKGFEEILFKISALGHSFKDEQRDDIYDYAMIKELLSMPIADMNISQSVKDLLSQNGIDIVKELCCCSEKQVRSFQNISQDDITDLNSVMSSLNIFYRPEIINKFMYLYPKYCKELTAETADMWEYRLYIEAFITNYEWLVKLRTKEVKLWQYTDEDRYIDNFDKLLKFIDDHIQKLLSIVENISFSRKDELTKAIGELGVAGDSYKIIIATENIIGFYKELLKQKLSFEKVDASEPYRALIEQMYSCIREMCDGFTELYNKMLIAKEKIKACIMGELDNKSVTVDLGLTMNADMDSLMETLKNVKRTEELINDR